MSFKQFVPKKPVVMAPRFSSDQNEVTNRNWKEKAKYMRGNWSPKDFDISDDTLKGIVTDEISLLTKTIEGTLWLKDWWDLEKAREISGYSVRDRLFHCPFTYIDEKNELRKNLWAEVVVNFGTTVKDYDVTFINLEVGFFWPMSKEKVKKLKNVKVKFSWWSWE